MKPTWSKTYRWPHEKPVKKIGECNVAIHVGTNIKGTSLAGMNDKMMNTGPMKLRYETMKKHGKKALARTFKR